MLPNLLTQVAASLKLAILYDESASVVSLWCQDIMLVSVLIRILASAQREDESSQGPLSFFWKRKPLVFFGRLSIIGRQAYVPRCEAPNGTRLRLKLPVHHIIYIYIIYNII